MPSGIEYATGYVSIVADTSRIPRQLAAAFGSAADRAERDFGQAFGDAAQRGGREMSEAFGRAADDAGRELSGALGRAGEQAGGRGGEAAAGGIADVLGGKAGAFGAVLGSVFAVAGVSAGGLFVKALQQGLEREKALDLTQARLGVDDETMAKIGLAAGKAYASNFGESVEGNIDAARRAVQSGLLDSSATAQETQAVISQLASVSDLMGEEIPAVARAAGQAIKTGIAGTATEAFDLFTAAEQNGLNVSEDFLDSVIEYGTQFRKLGLSGPEAIGLINQAVLAGARDTDVAADAIKEFAIRVVDGSDSTSEAFETLGFRADDLTKRFAAGGETAHAAVTDLLGKIREIEDPVEKNTIALALFGTQFEDLGDALGEFDLDDAVTSLGKVNGAAQEAINTMGGNAASSIESAKRSIEVSADGISSALAQAFGPELEKVADWVTTHQPEILGFLGKLADGAFASADAFLSFTSVSLRAFADFAEGLGPLLDHVLDPIGKVAEVIGKLSHNSGLQDLGHTLQDLDSTMSGVADSARDIADGIDNSARPHLEGLRDSVASNIEQAVAAKEVFRALGDTVIALPSEHGIELKDNTPEATARLEALGLKVTTLPDGTVEVTADTAEGQAKLDAFVVANTGRKIPLTAELTASINRDVENIEARWSRANGGIIPGRAAGGMFHGVGGPTADANLVALSNGEYVVKAASTAKALPWLQAINDGWVPPPGMVPGFAGGGLVPGKAFAQSMDPAAYGMGGFSRSVIDCSGMVAATVNDVVGKPPFSDRTSTVTMAQFLAARGGQPGLGGPGDVAVAWFDHGGGPNGHAAMRLSDGTGVESRSGDGVVIGADATPVTDPMFDQAMHIPKKMLLGGDLGPSGAGAGAPAGAGGGAPAGAGGNPGSGAGLSGNASGGSFGGQEVPPGGGAGWISGAYRRVAPPPPPPRASTPSAAPAESFAPQETKPADMPDVGARMAKAGGDFLSTNFDQFLGDLGLRSSGGALQTLVSAIVDHVAEAAAAEVRKAQAQSASSAAPFMGRR